MAQVTLANFETNLVLEDDEVSQWGCYWQNLERVSERNLYQNRAKNLVVKREKGVVRATEDYVSGVWFVIHIPEVLNFYIRQIFYCCVLLLISFVITAVILTPGQEIMSLIEKLESSLGLSDFPICKSKLEKEDKDKYFWGQTAS